MIGKQALKWSEGAAVTDKLRMRLRSRLAAFPWWLAAIFLIAAIAAITISTNQDYREAFNFIKAGIGVTLSTTLIAFVIALLLGLLTGLGRISNSVFFKNAATLYIELIRGVPMLVLIFFIAFVGMPAIVDGLNRLGELFISMQLVGVGEVLTSLKNNAISMNVRAIAALSITYGAFLAEIFRAGIESIGRGQMEAARSQGMTYAQAMRYVILPQAIRNVLPALSNDFVSMLKDSSLVSVLAVRDITQIARLYAGHSFQYQQAYSTLAVLYLTMTIILSFGVKFLEKRVRQNERN